MEIHGRRWKECSLHGLWSLVQRNVLRYCFAGRYKGAKAPGQRQDMRQWSKDFVRFFTFPVLVFCFAPFLSILKLSITSGILCVFHVSNVFTFEFGDFWGPFFFQRSWRLSCMYCMSRMSCMYVCYVMICTRNIMLCNVKLCYLMYVRTYVRTYVCM